jgi:NitT/TauT family transport system substrate-binding protein
MKRFQLGCAIVISSLLLLTLAGGTARSADGPDVRILMDWFAQADQAGFWEIQTDGLGKPYHITVLQGGPKIQTIPQVAAGQAEFGIANADDILLARVHGAPVRAILAFFDYVPYDLVYHRDPAIKKISDLKDKTFAVNLGFGYWEWIKKRYGMTNAHEIPVTGDLSMFRLDSNMVQQGYSIFLPYRLDALGVPNAQFKMADLGYRPYATLFTTDAMIQQHPDEVRAVIATVIKGWQNFVSDPSKVRPLILGMNSLVPGDVHDKAVAEMKQTLIPRKHFGCMSDARWAELAKQLQDVNLLPAAFDPKQGYDATLVPGCR